MEHKIEIGLLDPGSRFYFPNDHKKVIWKVLDSKRLAASGTQVFIYCEDEYENIEDFNSNREVYCLKPDGMPSTDNYQDEEEKPLVKERNKLKVINRPTTIRKSLRSTLNADFLNHINNLNSDMHHQESSVKVYATNNYSVFRMINGNRDLDDRKIKRIIKEIEAGNDMLQYYPIPVKEVGERLDILDGQNRFYIDKKLKRPVYYILVAEEKSMLEIAKVNSNVEKWKPKDFINCYVQLGNENYEILKQFLDKYDISLSVSLIMLSTGEPGTESAHNSINDSFRSGTFEVKKLTEATQLAEECRFFKSFPNWRSRAFVIAIYRIKKANLISLEDLVAAYKKRPEMLTEQANYKAYVNTLEQIVNVGKQKRIVII